MSKLDIHTGKKDSSQAEPKDKTAIPRITILSFISIIAERDLLRGGGCVSQIYAFIVPLLKVNVIE
jgi:hypothetical protein